MGAWWAAEGNHKSSVVPQMNVALFTGMKSLAALPSQCNNFYFRVRTVSKCLLGDKAFAFTLCVMEQVCN